jgi:hypothetical protein
MGKNDSSHTRVAPVFNQLLAQDPTSVTWVPRLLTLPRLDGRPPYRLGSNTRPLTARGWGASEYRLSPPRTLLRWMVRNAAQLQPTTLGSSAVTIAKRQALLQRDHATVAEALAYLARPVYPAKAWYVLEGLSQPDVYLETPEVLVVIEGKRTEAGPTTYTSWMPRRHQMLRHLDCAWEIRGQRAVLGFFIVEGLDGADAVAVPAHWQIAARATITPPALDDSLPHRTSTERLAIADSFLGVTTWQQLCATFQLDYTALPDEG